MRSKDRDHLGQPTWWNPISTKNTKISGAWWHSTIVPATQESKVGGSRQPGRVRLQWPMFMSLHFSLGWQSETLSPNKQTNKENKEVCKVSRFMLWMSGSDRVQCISTWLQSQCSVPYNTHTSFPKYSYILVCSMLMDFSLMEFTVPFYAKRAAL